MTLTGSCTDYAGKTASATTPALRYDATPPRITGWSASRRPDFHGWYNHPVTFRFSGSDALSGIDGCSSPTYGGPDSGAATVTGACRDRAGNVGTLPVGFRYDATPPALMISADAGDQLATLHWRTEPNLTGFSISRAPGLSGSRASVLDRNAGSPFYDTRVRNGVRYRYTVRARDAAGNVSVRTIDVTPGLRLLAPAPRATVTSPPVLRWTRARHASYYNVQLYRGRTKILSAWPTQGGLRLSGTWTFEGHRYVLKPGRYQWYVWPGIGPRSAGRYGPLIGTRTFIVAQAT